MLEYSEFQFAELLILGAEERQHTLQEEMAIEEGRHPMDILHGSLYLLNNEIHYSFDKSFRAL